MEKEIQVKFKINQWINQLVKKKSHNFGTKALPNILDLYWKYLGDTLQGDQYSWFAGNFPFIALQVPGNPLFSDKQGWLTLWKVIAYNSKQNFQNILYNSGS